MRQPSVGSGAFPNEAIRGSNCTPDNNPATLPRAAFIPARPAQVEINDNWANKPTHSLDSIFRAWMPRTAASHQQGVDLMKKLADRFPDVAWKICVGQFGTHHQVGDYSHKLRWRPDGYGFGEPFRLGDRQSTSCARWLKWR
jgi:hypothetical protein